MSKMLVRTIEYDCGHVSDIYVVVPIPYAPYMVTDTINKMDKKECLSCFGKRVGNPNIINLNLNGELE